MIENYKYCTKFGNLVPYFDNLLPYLPYKSQFLKCCHFLVIYHSEINESWLTKLNFFYFSFCLIDFPPDCAYSSPQI